MYTIKNDRLELTVSAMGAQILSIAKDGLEMMWQRDDKFWGKTSPVLFPFVGKLKDDQYIANDEIIAMNQHGFARDREFRLDTHSDNSLYFVYDSDESDLALYPYPFQLAIEYVIDESKVITNYYVENKSEIVMPFQIGAHPAFNVENVDQLSFEFEKQSATKHYFKEGLQTKTEQVDLALVDLGYDIINHNLPCFSDLSCKSGVLKKDDKSFIRFEFDSMTHIAFWSPEFKKAPFICVEPWLGICSNVNQPTLALEDKDAMTHLAPNSKMKCGYSFEFLD